MTYEQTVYRAAVAHHLTWCHHHMCVHTPFPKDLALANSLLGPLGPDITADHEELEWRRARDSEIREGLAQLERIDKEWAAFTDLRDAAVGLRAALLRIGELG